MGPICFKPKHLLIRSLDRPFAHWIMWTVYTRIPIKTWVSGHSWCRLTVFFQITNKENRSFYLNKLFLLLSEVALSVYLAFTLHSFLCCNLLNWLVAIFALVTDEINVVWFDTCIILLMLIQNCGKEHVGYSILLCWSL